MKKHYTFPAMTALSLAIAACGPSTTTSSALLGNTYQQAFRDRADFGEIQIRIDGGAVSITSPTPSARVTIRPSMARADGTPTKAAEAFAIDTPDDGRR